MRSDAIQNREAIIAAASRLFAERGLDVSSNEIARHAGVGIATLLRRFPTRGDLLAAGFADKMGDYSRVVKEALDANDPWDGFAHCLMGLCELQAQDRGFALFLATNIADDAETTTLRDRAHTDMAEVIDRAHISGRLRSDVVMQDVALALMANAGVISITRDAAPSAWRRIASHLLRSFDATGETPVPPPPTTDEISVAMSTAAT